jgi:hypothetical protein
MGPHVRRHRSADPEQIDYIGEDVAAGHGANMFDGG